MRSRRKATESFVKQSPAGSGQKGKAAHIRCIRASLTIGRHDGRLVREIRQDAGGLLHPSQVFPVREADAWQGVCSKRMLAHAEAGSSILGIGGGTEGGQEGTQDTIRNLT